MDNLVNQDELDLAGKMAYVFSAKWKLINYEDLKSHLTLWLYANVKYLENWRKETGQGKLYVSLRREAAKYCAKETQMTAHIDLDIDNPYKITEVYAALDYYFEFDFTSYEIDNNTSSKVYQIMSDIRSSLNNSSNTKDKKIIYERYKENKSFVDLAEVYNITVKAAEKRVERAVHRLYESLVSSIFIDNLFNSKDFYNDDQYKL